MFKLAKILTKIIISALAYAETLLLNALPNGWDDVKVAIRLEFTRLRQITAVFGDDNPKNKEQVLAILKEIKGQDVPILFKQLLLQSQGAIKDERLRLIVSILSMPVVETVTALTDDNPNNDEQVKAILSNLLKDNESKEAIFEQLLIPFLQAQIKDETSEKFVINILRSLLFPEN